MSVETPKSNEREIWYATNAGNMDAILATNDAVLLALDLGL